MSFTLPAFSGYGIEHHKVIRIYSGLETIAQGVATQKNCKGTTAAFQFPGADDDALEWFSLAPIVVHGMQAGRAAGCFIRLWQGSDRQAYCCP